MALTQVDQGLLGTYAQYTGFKNRILNGQMVIDQRNAGASVSASVSGTYFTDRWAFYGSPTSKFTAQQSNTAPAGYINSLLLTSSSAYTVASGDFIRLVQRIEGLNVADLGWGTASAATVTLSFQARSSLTGTFSGYITNSGQSRTYPFTFTINSANTFETKTVTIVGDTSGTWLTTNGTGIELGFQIGVGSTYLGTAGAWASAIYFGATGGQNLVATNGATLYITGVQLEKGSTATSFDYREYGEELRKCQRYCFSKIGSQGSGGAAMLGAGGNARSTTQAYVQYIFPVTMRQTPSLTVLNPTSFLLYQTSVIQATAVSLDVADPNAASIAVTVASGLTSPTFYSFGCNNGNAQLIYSAEL